MKAKEYLSQARFLDSSIKAKLEQIQVLDSLATSCSVVISDMPGSPNRGTSRMENTITKIVDLREEINRDMNRLVELKREIMVLIKSVSSLEYQTILEKRYLSFDSWEKISVDLGYSIQHTYRLHDAALREVEGMMRVKDIE